MSEPKIAALVPVYNEEPVIETTIRGLLAAGFLKSDIYVVNDRSTDRTEELAKAMGVNVFTVPVNGGKAKAQVQALKYFMLCDRYDWVTFLDGDTKVEPTFLTTMKEAMKEADPRTALFVGQVKSSNDKHIFSAARAYDYAFGQEIFKKGQDNFGVIFVSPGCASVYRTDFLRTANIDHNTLAEDMDLTVQVHRSGKKVKYVHQAGVVTQDPGCLQDYHKQVLRWYRGFWQVVLKHNTLWWGKKNRVDFYMGLMAVDALFFNRFVVLVLGLLLFEPHLVAFGLLADIAVFSLIGAWFAVATKRADIFFKAPLFYWITWLNLYALLRSFFEIIIFRRQLLAWNKVKRYTFAEKNT